MTRGGRRKRRRRRRRGEKEKEEDEKDEEDKEVGKEEGWKMQKEWTSFSFKI